MFKKLGCVCVCSVTGTCVTFGYKLELQYEITINVKRQSNSSSSSEVSGNSYIQNTQNTSKLIKNTCNYSDNAYTKTQGIPQGSMLGQRKDQLS